MDRFPAAAEADVAHSGWRSKLAMSVVIVAMGALAMAVPPARAAPAQAWIAGPDTGHGDVTLITGDVVHVAPAGNGRSAVTVTPARRSDGARPSFWVSQRGRELTVLPGDVAPLMPDRLDPALFDVTSLLAQGYGDAQTSTIPLIATFDGAPPALPATTLARRLPSIHGGAMRVAKASAAQLGGKLGALAEAERRHAKTAGPLAGVRKLWLDARVKVRLDGNLTQIGAPRAWDAGYDGAGVKVAVLDTGIDTSHPDLAGAVAASHNLTTAADALDHHGHGTHVASVAAGRGTAGDGERRGVAHGATLLNGKVLDDDGTGFTSWVVAGMEWASSSQHADIVNMSLGFGSGTSVDNPVTAAVDRLTAANNTLFVVAAGNDGCAACISSPADSPSALTVGAVDGNDRLAGFSGRGPVPGTFAVKPDITAPGVDIIAARAAGTTLGMPAGRDYTTLSGTSMAAPHVAGAAALLLQARGALPPRDLKAALMDTAQPTSGVSIYDQGAGRLDAGRVVTSPVIASPGVIDFGRFTWPYPAHVPERAITYRNSADRPITLTLSSDLDALRVTPSQLTLPPGGSAAAQVVVDTSGGAAGTFGGSITARAAGGGAWHTTVGFVKEPEMHDVHVKGIARDGRPAFGTFRVVDVHDGGIAARRLWPGNPAAPCSEKGFADSDCIRLPVGTYSIMGFIFTMPPDKPSTEGARTALNTSLVGDPQVTIDKDTTLTLDARAAREVTVDTPGRDARANMGGAAQIAVSRTPEKGPAVTEQVINSPGTQLEERLFMMPTQAVTVGDLSAYTRWRLDAPSITFTAPRLSLRPEYYDPVWFSDVSAQYPRLDGTARLRVVDAGTATATELEGRDLRGTLALVRRSNDIPVAKQSNNAAAAGARMVAIYNDGPGVNADPGEIGIMLRVPTVRLSHEEGTALLASPGVTVTARGQVAGPYAYELIFPERGRIPRNPHYTARLGRLASVTRDFRGEPGREMSFGEAAFAFQPGDTFAISTMRPLARAPRTRTDYHVGDPNVRWSYSLQTPEPNYNNIFPKPDIASMLLDSPTMRTYRPGERRSDEWLAGPIAPGLNPRQPLQRSGNGMRVHMSGFVDAAGNFGNAGSSLFDHGLITQFRMFAGDEQIAETRFRPVGTIAVPAADTNYRIDYRVDNASPWAALSSRTSARWTFRSRTAPAGQVIIEPLITVDYDLDLDLYNQLPKNRRAVIGLNLGHQTGASASPISTVSLDLSTDDGESWHPVALSDLGGGRYVAAIAPPGGFVSLRLHAADRDGGTLSQEIVRAFMVASR
jgi:subtilisin family serine protease